MNQNKKLQAAYELLISSQKSLQNAKKILEELGVSVYGDSRSKSKKPEENFSLQWLSSYADHESKIIEGVFTGDAMFAVDGNMYPVPHNYACKSHLVQGSKLKATIDASGKILYKIISEIPYEHKKWLLVESNGKYQVIADGKAYHVLPAAVTFLKAQIGDMLSIRIPEGKDATYGAPDVVIPKS